MATAMAFPEAAKLRRKGSSVLSSGNNSEYNGSSAGHISKARYVLRNNITPENQQYPDRCLAVMAGTMTLTEAYASTQEDVRRREEEARIRNENLEKLAGIREQCQAPYQYHPVLIAGYARPKGLEGAGV